MDSTYSSRRRSLCISLFALLLITTVKISGQTPATTTTPVGNRDSYLARYGQSDSSRALIKYWFRKRKAGKVVLAAGAALLATGLILQPTAPPTSNNPGTGTTVLIIAGGGLMLGGGAETISRSLKRLEYFLQHPTALPRKQWKRIINEEGTALVAPEQAPTTAEEARRLQEEHWRKRGKVPRKRQQ